MRGLAPSAVLIAWGLAACSEAPSLRRDPVDPGQAEVVAIDRFSDAAGRTQRRSLDPTLPAPNAPIDFDQGAPFFLGALGPSGERVSLYNFGPVVREPIPLYVLFQEGEPMPVPGQLNIVPFIPGEPEYTDYWRVTRVIVPRDYVANTATSLADLTGNGFVFERTNTIVNCPLVPAGSTAIRRYRAEEPAGLIPGWYRGKLVTYFTFAERELFADSFDALAVSRLYITYNLNPDPGDPRSGIASGARTDAEGRTRAVVATLPSDATYTPLRELFVYDNEDFSTVRDLPTAAAARPLLVEPTLLNLPIVVVE